MTQGMTAGLGGAPAAATARRERRQRRAQRARRADRRRLPDDAGADELPAQRGGPAAQGRDGGPLSAIVYAAFHLA